MLVKEGWVCSEGSPCLLAQQMCVHWLGRPEGQKYLKEKVIHVVYKSATANEARAVSLLLELMHNVIFAVFSI